ncbi:MAG: MBL fold metallo-hydrolase [bacterium]|nr:MBL fold metallo-hydrolase [bacterium]
MKNYLYPIAGANHIGVSSYFVNLSGVKIILDAGAKKGISEVYPDYSSIVYEGHVNSLDEMDLIILSHAHFDHIGSLLYIAGQAKNATIIASKTTKDLIRMQLVDFGRCITHYDDEKIKKAKLVKMEEILNRIEEVSVLHPIERKGVKITLYPAGHMAGATMTYIEGQEQSILYTGDFSFETILGMNKPHFDGLRPDILILNGTNGYRYRVQNHFNYKELDKKIRKLLKNGANVLLKSTSIAKHLDLFYALKIMKVDTKIYLDKDSELIADGFSNLGYYIYSEKITGYVDRPKGRHVLISQMEHEGYQCINVDKYSLHASFAELINTVYLFGPKKVFVVHSEPHSDMLCFMDDLKLQGRYFGECIQCKDKRVYSFD